MVTTIMNNEQRMTSLEIAELTGKQHKDVLKAIRAMEPTWTKHTERKFALSTYKDSTGRKLPCYELTKLETLYISTKFNDEARAKLVLRWHQLELERIKAQAAAPKPMLMLETEHNILHRCDEIRLQQIGTENSASQKCLTASEVAKTLGLTTMKLNRRLVRAGVQYRDGKRYRLTPEYDNQGYGMDRDYHYYSLDGEKQHHDYLVWTPLGVELIINKVKEGKK